MMHRVTWTPALAEQPAVTWLVPDGLVRPHHVVLARSGLIAVLLIGRRGVALAPAERYELGPDEPFELPGEPGAVLRWCPLAEQPAPLSRDPTRGEPNERDAVPYHFMAGGESVVVNPGELVLVGRHPTSDLRLTDSRVSALHCALVAAAGGVEVVDLGSRNGTRVEGTRVHAASVNGRAVLSIGPVPAALEPEEAARSDLIRLPSREMQRIYRLLDRLAPNDAPVFIEGESGTGKEGVARSLHSLSGREGRFVTLNAALLTPELAASELFGHHKGAFTGAVRDRDGAFCLAHNGTLFLDEIGELRTDVQAELLRVIEERRVRPLGASEAIPVDVRLVTATHRDLPALVSAGAFRVDLFHRIWVLPLKLPPLRDRREDIDVLACEFLAEQRPKRRLSTAARQELWTHDWPGNIRELLNTLRRTCVLTDARTLEPHHLRLAAQPGQPATLDHVVRQSVLATYAKHDNSVAATARELGIHRSTVYRHLRQARNERARLG